MATSLSKEHSGFWLAMIRGNENFNEGNYSKAMEFYVIGKFKFVRCIYILITLWTSEVINPFQKITCFYQISAFNKIQFHIY